MVGRGPAAAEPDDVLGAVLPADGLTEAALDPVETSPSAADRVTKTVVGDADPDSDEQPVAMNTRPRAATIVEARLREWVSVKPCIASLWHEPDVSTPRIP